MELLLTGSAEDLTAELSQTELIYARSPGYDGADAIQVVLLFRVIVFSLSFPGCWLLIKLYLTCRVMIFFLGWEAFHFELGLELLYVVTTTR